VSGAEFGVPPSGGERVLFESATSNVSAARRDRRRPQSASYCAKRQAEWIAISAPNNRWIRFIRSAPVRVIRGSF